MMLRLVCLTLAAVLAAVRGGSVVNSVSLDLLYNTSEPPSTNTPSNLFGGTTSVCEDLGLVVSFGGMDRETQLVNGEVLLMSLSEMLAGRVLWLTANETSYREYRNGTGYNLTSEEFFPSKEIVSLFGHKAVGIPTTQAATCKFLVLGGTHALDTNGTSELNEESMHHWEVDLTLDTRLSRITTEELWDSDDNTSIVQNVSVDEYSVYSVVWTKFETTHEPQPRNRIFHQTFLSDDKVFVFGGLAAGKHVDAEAEALGDFWEFDIISRNWTAIVDIPLPPPRLAANSYLRSSQRTPQPFYVMVGGIGSAEVNASSSNSTVGHTVSANITCYDGNETSELKLRVRSEIDYSASCGKLNISLNDLCVVQSNDTQGNSSLFSVTYDIKYEQTVSEGNESLSVICQVERMEDLFDENNTSVQELKLEHFALGDIWSFSFETLQWTLLYNDMDRNWIGMSFMEGSYLLLLGSQQIDKSILGESQHTILAATGEDALVDRVGYLSRNPSATFCSDNGNGLCGEGVLETMENLPIARYNAQLLSLGSGKSILFGGMSFQDGLTSLSGLWRNETQMTLYTDYWLIEVESVSAPEILIEIQLNVFISSVGISLLICGLSLMSGCFAIYRRMHLNVYGLETQEDTSNAHRRRATKQMISELPQVKYGKVKGEDFASGDMTCPICLTEFVDKDQLRSLPCKHMFHHKCIRAWLMVDKSCPLCKHDIDLKLDNVENTMSMT